MKKISLVRWLCALGLLILGSAPVLSKDLQFLRTPPSEVAYLEKDDLNIFGRKILSEIYYTHALISKTSGDTIPKPEDVDPQVLEEISNLYDDDVLIQRARSNFGQTKATFFPDYITTFSLSDIAVTRSGPTTLILSYDVFLPERTSLRSGTVMSGKPYGRIVVLRWDEKHAMWKIFSYADFDVPRAMLCDANLNYVSPKSQFDASEIELGRKLLLGIQEASLNSTEKSVQSEGFQYVFASGERKTGSGKVRTRVSKIVEPQNVEAIRSDDLLVVRQDTDDDSLSIDGGGIEEEKQKRPGLFTFRLDPDGQWRMIAIGIFASTKKIGNSTRCLDKRTVLTFLR
jgi:hypothetical protein